VPPYIIVNKLNVDTPDFQMGYITNCYIQYNFGVMRISLQYMLLDALET